MSFTFAIELIEGQIFAAAERWPMGLALMLLGLILGSLGLVHEAHRAGE